MLKLIFSLATISLLTMVQSLYVAPPLERAAKQILQHQTDDGAIVMGALPAKRSHLMPYFANFAARGLIVAFGETGTTRYLDAAKRWIAWYETHLNADGTIYDYNGSSGGWEPTGDYDSTDSYAATYLDLLLATYQVTSDHSWLQARLPSVRQAVAAIRLTLQPNGLTTAKPKWPVMYLMDNTETATGLRAAEGMARLLADVPLEQQARVMADNMEQAIARKLWDNTRQVYYIGLQMNGRLVVGQETWYPHVMANLMAAGWLPTSERQCMLLVRIKKQFSAEIPDGVQTESDLDHLVWWGIAARGTGDRPLLMEITRKLADFDKQKKQFTNPGLLGHLCRLFAPR